MDIVVIIGVMIGLSLVGGFFHNVFRNSFQTPMFEFTVADYGVWVVFLWPIFLLMIAGSRIHNWLLR